MNVPAVDHSERIQAIIDAHFDAAHARVDPFHDVHLGSFKAIIGKHWRHKRDVPRDAAAPLVGIYNFARKCLSSSPGTEPYVSRKVRELNQLIYTDLLDIPGLQSSLEDYCTVQEGLLVQAVDEVYGELSAAQKLKFDSAIRDKMDELNIPSDGLREIIITSIVGIAGRKVSANVAFGSVFSTGSAAAYSLYIGQQSIFGALWIKAVGPPLWVGLAGGFGAILLTMATIVPLVSPVTEWGLNTMRGKKYCMSLLKKGEPI